MNSKRTRCRFALRIQKSLFKSTRNQSTFFAGASPGNFFDRNEQVSSHKTLQLSVWWNFQPLCFEKITKHPFNWNSPAATARL